MACPFLQILAQLPSLQPSKPKYLGRESNKEKIKVIYCTFVFRKWRFLAFVLRRWHFRPTYVSNSVKSRNQHEIDWKNHQLSWKKLDFMGLNYNEKEVYIVPFKLELVQIWFYWRIVPRISWCRRNQPQRNVENFHDRRFSIIHGFQLFNVILNQVFKNFERFLIKSKSQIL